VHHPVKETQRKKVNLPIEATQFALVSHGHLETHTYPVETHTYPVHQFKKEIHKSLVSHAVEDTHFKQMNHQKKETHYEQVCH
jgi:hypothetical protein